MRGSVIGGLLAAGLLAGCGGVEMNVDEQSNLETREDALPACNGQQYERVFYSEPEMINEVGSWSCSCGDSSAWTYGRTTAYSKYLYRSYCY